MQQQAHLKPFVWHKTADQILERLANYCATINQRGISQRTSLRGYEIW
jgi:hypothetical protein